MLGTVIVCYLIISFTVFSFWLGIFWGDSTTSKTDWLSWIALLVAPLFWPLILPLSNLELATKLSTTTSGINQRKEII